MTRIQEHAQIRGSYTANSPEQLEDTPARSCVPPTAPPARHICLLQQSQGGGLAVGRDAGVRGQRTVQLLARGHLAGLQHKLALQLLGQLLRQERALKLPGAGTVL